MCTKQICQLDGYTERVIDSVGPWGSSTTNERLLNSGSVVEIPSLTDALAMYCKQSGNGPLALSGPS